MDVKIASGPLVDYVGRYVRLQRRGRQSQGLCPFHAERTPSFYVYSDHFHCYGCGAHGDLFDFLAKVEKRDLGEVIRDLRDRSGLANAPSAAAQERLAAHRQAVEALASEPDSYELVSPQPANIPPLWPGEGAPTVAILRPAAALTEALKTQLPVAALHAFQGYRGEMLGYVVRTPKNRHGKKGAFQVAWCRNVLLADGTVQEGWTFVSFPEPRPVYGAPRVSDAREDGRPDRYLVVEGEKCADRGAVLSDWTVVSWVGGTNAWLKTDWSLIAEGEEVVLWPDADASRVGHKAMANLGKHLAALGCRNLRWIEPPADAPNKWDLADAVDLDGWTANRLSEFVASAQPWRPEATAEPALESAEGSLPPGMPPRPPARDKVLTEQERVSLQKFEARRRPFLAVVNSPPPVLQFALPGFLRGTVGLLVGAGGSGKSWAMLQSLICLAAGLDIWSLWSDMPDTIVHLPCPAGRCLYLAAEDPQEIVDWRTHHLGLDAAERLRAAGYDVNRYLDLIDQNLGTFSLYGGGQENAFAVAPSRTETVVQRGPLYENLVQVGFGSLAIGMDTLGRVASTLEEKEGVDMGQVIDLAEALTVDTGRANVLFSHHVTKSAALNGQAQEQQAVSGSRKLTDHVRWQANMATMDANTAKIREIDDTDRRKWVNVVAAKMNYASNDGARWWRRTENGILVGGFSPPEQQQRQPNLAGGSVSARPGSHMARMSREVAGE
ncbi:CHC2 zinc finger domain-containing protein [Dankookia rubra]|uniref:CHC2 zinc finger domain-containing protein n=1 Tax=Dankookia rubra TaxID=1442381 RepID=UPI00140C4F6A|nr:CHC2 zinc finger domain-containing protein [Dankookia rubra]